MLDVIFGRPPVAVVPLQRPAPQLVAIDAGGLLGVLAALLGVLLGQRQRPAAEESSWYTPGAFGGSGGPWGPVTIASDAGRADAQADDAQPIFLRRHLRLPARPPALPGARGMPDARRG